jgi:hypothetical protein
MGHEIVVYKERAEVVHDTVFEAVRHFLLIEAEASGQTDLALFVRGWENVGPGVWIGADFDLFFHGDKVLEQRFLALIAGARQRLAAFGEVVPLDYLKGNINPMYEGSPPVGPWFRFMDRLANLFRDEAPITGSNNLPKSK